MCKIKEEKNGKEGLEREGEGKKEDKRRGEERGGQQKGLSEIELVNLMRYRKH